MDIYDNIVLPALIAKKKINKQKVMDILAYCGLVGQENKYPMQLSGGEQQRVAIARSLYMEPKILFADESTGNLDSKNAIKIMELFKKINKEHNVTIIQVTHSLELAKYANRILEISDGKIIK